jgi:hypothetical protein
MKSLPFNRYALGTCAIAAMLTGCGGSQPSIAASGSLPSHNKRGWSETVSSDSPGGCATGVKAPRWQHVTSYCKDRLENDVAAVAESVEMYDSYGYDGWLSAGGTSISTPFLAGVFGLAGNASKQVGGRTFWEAAHQKHLYSPSGGSACPYSRGTYSTCSGWGTPDGIGAL